MATVTLDDLDAAPKKKKKKKFKAASSSVPAKKSKSVSLSTAKKSKKVDISIKKKKKKSEVLDTNIDLDSTLEGLGTSMQQGSETEQALHGQLLDAVSHIPPSVQRDNEQFQEYLTMFKQCAAMARAIEERFEERRSPRDVYPLMKLYEQMREIIADLRAIKDVTELGATIDEEVIAPMTENIATSFIGFHQAILAWNNANLDPNQIANAKMHFDHLLKKHAKEIEQAYHASTDKMMQIFAAE